MCLCMGTILGRDPPAVVAMIVSEEADGGTEIRREGDSSFSRSSCCLNLCACIKAVQQKYSPTR